MNKTQRKIFGLFGLAVVALMTFCALLLPDQASAEGPSDSHTDTIRVTVYDQKPTVSFVSPGPGYTQSNPLFSYDLSYSYTEHLYLDLSYWTMNESTNQPEITTIPFHSPEYASDGKTWAWTPEELDPTFHFASGELNMEFNLATCKSRIGNDPEVDIPNCHAVREGGIHYDANYLPENDGVLGYNCYGLHATVVSGGGMAENDTYFCYVPATLTQIGSDPDNNDPIVEIRTDKSVGSVGLLFYDEDWNPINTDPFMVEAKDFLITDPVTGEIIGNAASVGENTGTSTGSGSGNTGTGTGTGTGTSGDSGNTGTGTGTGTSSPLDQILLTVVSNTGLARLTLPFGSYGLASGNYNVRIIAYGEDGEEIPYPERMYYEDENGNLKSRAVAYYVVNYIMPEAPAIPDTGRFLANLGVSKSDYIATMLVVFVFVLAISFFIFTKSKTNYRKNYGRVRSSRSVSSPSRSSTRNSRSVSRKTSAKRRTKR